MTAYSTYHCQLTYFTYLFTYLLYWRWVFPAWVAFTCQRYRVPTPPEKSWIFFVKFQGLGKFWKMGLVLESPGNFSERSWKVVKFFRLWCTATLSRNCQSNTNHYACRVRIGKRNVTVWCPSVCLPVPSPYLSWLIEGQVGQHGTWQAYISVRQ